MSLLMEALKKAEEAKRLGIEDLPGPRATPRTRSSSATPGENDPRVLGESPAPHPLDSDQAGQTSARHSNSLANAERTAARNLFSAKQSAHNNTTLWFIGAAALVAALALGDLGGAIRYVVDSAPFKQNRFTPATHLPIVPPARLADDPPAAIIVMAASYSDEVVRLIREHHRLNLPVAILRPHGLEHAGPARALK